MGRSDSRSALPLFTFITLIGFVAPSPPMSWHPVGLTAGAETGLSCSHDGCPAVPRPLRRRVPRCCTSKLFTPSVAFAHTIQARLPVVPLLGQISRRGRLRFMLRTGGLHSPFESSTPRFDAQVSPYAGGLLRRVLVPPSAGLSPASHRELPGRTLCQSGGGEKPIVMPAKVTYAPCGAPSRMKMVARGDTLEPRGPGEEVGARLALGEPERKSDPGAP
jgi:hypothetical protein